MTPFETVREIIGGTFAIDPIRITEATERADIPEWDSVGHLNLMLSLEEALGVVLEIEQIERLTSVAALVEFAEAVRPSR